MDQGDELRVEGPRRQRLMDSGLMDIWRPTVWMSMGVRKEAERARSSRAIQGTARGERFQAEVCRRLLRDLLARRQHELDQGRVICSGREGLCYAAAGCGYGIPEQ